MIILIEKCDPEGNPYRLLHTEGGLPLSPAGIESSDPWRTLCPLLSTSHLCQTLIP